MTPEWHQIVVGWATVAATLVGAVLVLLGLLDTARARKEQNAILRKTETLRMLVETLNQRAIAGEVLPLDRDAEGVARTVANACGQGPEAEATATAIRQYLNYWETVAGGVRDGVLDEDLLRGRARGRVVAIWHYYGPFIAKRRELAGSPDLWADLEALASKWAGR